MIMHTIFNPNSDVDRQYLPRKKGGRRLTRGEHCAKMEENSFSWCVERSVEPTLKVVECYSIVITDKAVDPKTLRKQIYKEKENNWKGKSMHGQFLKEIKGNDLVNSWKWMS